MHQLWSDIRYSLRALGRRPGFTLVIFITLALGIGANSSVFSLVDALILRPFPIPEIESLAMLCETIPQRDEDSGNIAPANYLDLRERNTTFQYLLAYLWWDVNLTGRGQPERLQGTLVTPGFLRALGVQPHLGQLFPLDPGGNPRTAVLSHRFWRGRFGGDPGIVGETVILNGDPHVVTGIGPAGFDYPFATDVWASLDYTSEVKADRSFRYFTVIGRYKEGIGRQDAQAEMDVLAANLAQEHPEHNEGRGLRVVPLREAVTDMGAPAFLGTWQATVVFVLLIACVNVANLLMARGSERTREVALRTALGASRRRVMRQLLTENLILALGGALLALPLAGLVTYAIRSTLPDEIRKFTMGWQQIGIDYRLLLFTAGVALLAALLFGLVPSLSASRIQLNWALGEGGRGGSSSPARQWSRRFLIIGEVAMAFLLLVAGGLTVRGSTRMLYMDQGFDPQGLLTFEVTLPANSYPDDASRWRFYSRLLDEIASLPGVKSAAATNSLPSSSSNWSMVFRVPGQIANSSLELPGGHWRAVTPAFFETLRIPIQSGRALGAQDRVDSPPVAVVSRLLAERAWPGEDPVGRRIGIGGNDDLEWYTVVGLCGDVNHSWYLGGFQPTVYLSLEQKPSLKMYLAVRTQGDPNQLTPSLRATLERIDPNQPMYNVVIMTDLVSRRMIGLKYAAAVMGGFGIVGLLLAIVGIYGVVSFAVSRRRREFGIRIALGADDRHVVGLTLRDALALTLAGMAIGLPVSLWGAKLMQAYLFGTITVDVGSLVAFALVITAASLLAAFVPARRAARVDPSEALRTE